MLRVNEPAWWSVPLLPHQSVGRFEIVREIGRGGFGVVYEALDTALSRNVALKTVRSAAGADGSRTLAEAEAAARLAHANIVHLYDVGREDRGPYLIMELLVGEALSDRLARGPLPILQAVGIAVEISRGVAYAHRQGVVHRDLKPGNVFLCADGQVKVLDFGLAQVFGRPGPAGGTARYMAPEQAQGLAGDERSDVYSLGVMFEELILRQGPEPSALRAAAQARSLAPVRQLLEEMTRADPAARPAGAAQVLARLLAVQRALEPRRWFLVGGVIVGVALALVLGFVIRAPPLPPGRLLLAMADTENPTGEPDLDGVSELLEAGLGESGRLSLLPRSAIVQQLRDAGRPTPPVIHEADARVGASRARAQLLTLPAVRHFGGGFEVSVRVVDLASDRIRYAGREPAAAISSVPAAVDRLVRGVREALSESAEQAPRAPVEVADVAPSNPQALGLYSEGRRLASVGLFREALVQFRRSIDADPKFLLPRVSAEEVMFGQVNGILTGTAIEIFPNRKESLAILRQNLVRIPGGDRVFVEYVLQRADGGTLGEEIAAADRAAQAAPADPRFPLHAAWQLLWERADVAAARPYLERVLGVASILPNHAILFLLYLRRTDEALARARRWAEEEPSGRSWYWLSEVHRQRGELVEGLAAARRGASMPDGILNQKLFLDAEALAEGDLLQRSRPVGRVKWLGSRGRVREAASLMNRNRPAPAGDRYLQLAFHVGMAHVYTPLEDPAVTFRELHRMLETGSVAFICEGWALAAMGDLDRAELLVSNFVGDKHGVCAGMTRAITRWKRGDVPGALAILARYPIGTSDFYRGEILADQGRDAEAIEAWRAYRPRRGLNFFEGFLDSYNFPRSLVLEARSLARLGRTDEARVVLGRFLRLWENADPGLPILARAKALQAELARGGAQVEARR